MIIQTQAEKKREKVKQVLNAGIGKEPSFITGMPLDQNRKSALAKALSWYSYIFNPKTGYQIVLDWVKKNCELTEEELSAFSRGYPSTFLSTHYGLIRMIDSGWEATEYEINSIKTAVAKTVKAGQRGVIVDEPAETEEDQTRGMVMVTKPKIDPLDERVKQLLTELDSIEDEWSKNNTVNLRRVELIQLMDRFGAKNVTGINGILGWVNARVEEYRGAADGTDCELVEGYDTRSKEWLKAVVAQLDEMKVALTTIQNQPKQIRRPRQIRQAKGFSVKSVPVSRVKYQKVDPELNVSSVDPSKLNGATTVWLLNTRYRFFTVLVAAQKGGLSVSGTTIDGYDPEKSLRKVTRDMKNMLGVVMGNTTKIAINHMNLLKTKPIDPNGRLNENTLILKVE